MTKYAILTSVLVLAACGGGSGGGGNGAPGKSAYEIWLDAGNTGTEQDFLDSLVSGTSSVSGGTQYASLLQKAQAEGGYTITPMSWPAHGGFYRIEKDYSSTYSNSPSYGNDKNYTRHYVYNEKELTLGNYGVELTKTSENYEFLSTTDVSYSVSTWINNREGIGANVYTPDNGTVFRGGTLAYLYTDISSSDTEPVFIKGNAEYTYSPTSPKLILDLDDYYTITLQNGYETVVSGTNNLGNNRFDINTGTALTTSNDVPKPGTSYSEIGFLKKNNIEEVVGKYDVYFINGPYATGAPNGILYLKGAFGGTKQ